MGLIQKTVYIRQEDLAAWNSLPNKALFIHSALEDYNGIAETVVPPPISVEVDRFGNIENMAKPLMETLQSSKLVTCKHGFPPKYCKFATAGKPCK